MPFHPHGNTPQLYTRTRAREYTFSLLASSIVLNWEACTFKPHGCYLDRVLNDFSFAAHLDRHNYARPARTYSTDHTFLGWCPRVTHRVQENLPRRHYYYYYYYYHYYYRGQNKNVQVSSFSMDFGDRCLQISVLKFSTIWTRQFGPTPLENWDWPRRLCQEIWKCTVSRRTGVGIIIIWPGQFISLRLSNLHRNHFEGCTVCLIHLGRIWSFHDASTIVYILVYWTCRSKIFSDLN